MENPHNLTTTVTPDDPTIIATPHNPTITVTQDWTKSKVRNYMCKLVEEVVQKPDMKEFTFVKVT
jgi:hypothetical protein